MELIDTEYKLQKKKDFLTAMTSQFPLHLKNCFLDEGKEMYEKLTCLLISDCHSSLLFFVASPIQLPTSPNGIIWIKQPYDDIIYQA